MSSDTPNTLRGEIHFYQVSDGIIALDVRFEHETIWLSQKQMALLFDKDVDTIGLHLRNIYAEGELEESTTTEESSVVQMEGKRQVRRQVRFYNRFLSEMVFYSKPMVHHEFQMQHLLHSH